MKAISIRQPWASMIIQGYKPVENRAWKANHRGPLAIHAAKKWDQKGADWITENFPHLEKEVEKARALRGGIIGSVVMTDCVSSHTSPWYNGEWGFVLKDPKPYTKIIPCNGKLMFFQVPDVDTWPNAVDRPQAAKEIA